jgi:hypothetical protein
MCDVKCSWFNDQTTQSFGQWVSETSSFDIAHHNISNLRFEDYGGGHSFIVQP